METNILNKKKMDVPNNNAKGEFSLYQMSLSLFGSHVRCYYASIVLQIIQTVPFLTNDIRYLLKIVLENTMNRVKSDIASEILYLANEEEVI